MWIIELVKVLAWPATVLVAIKWLNISIILQNILKRKLEFELPGFKAKIDPAEQQQAEASPSHNQLPSSIEPSPRTAVNVIEKRLRNELSVVDASKKEAILLRALAQSQLQAGHEFTYNRIFGSQIAALRKLNEVGQTTIEDAREFFKPYAVQYPQIYDRYGFDSWLGFLKNNSLIIQNDNIVIISDFGRDFLVYLIEARLSEAKGW